MKILCVSDQIDPLVYSSLAKERFASVDAILCAGDLPSDYIDFIVSTLNKPAFFIFGNHNLTEFRYYHKQKKVLQYHKIEIVYFRNSSGPLRLVTTLISIGGVR